MVSMTYHDDIYTSVTDAGTLWHIPWFLWHIKMTYTRLWHITCFPWHIVVPLWHIMMTYVSMTYLMTYSDPSVAWWHIFMTYNHHDICHDIYAMTYTCVTMTYTVKKYFFHDFSWHMPWRMLMTYDMSCDMSWEFRICHESICHGICHGGFFFTDVFYITIVFMSGTLL